MTTDGPAPSSTEALQRRPPLPWQQVKSVTEDALAPSRVQAILDNASYRQPDRDIDFLESAATRPIRLQLDYLKPELKLSERGVEHTIVVFGSTRIVEPATAQLELEAAERALTAHDADPRAQQRVAVARRRAANAHYYKVARELGRLIGAAGSGPEDCRVALITGGGPGIMEAANRGTFDVGAQSIGLNITLPHEQYPNPYVTPDLCFRFHYFALRKLHFLLRARALVAFPGGYGTFDELFETLTLVQTRKIRPVPVVLVGKQYWQQAVNFDFLLAEGVVEAEDLELFSYAESAQEIWQGILSWHERNGTPLF